MTGLLQNADGIYQMLKDVTKDNHIKPSITVFAKKVFYEPYVHLVQYQLGLGRSL